MNYSPEQLGLILNTPVEPEAKPEPTAFEDLDKRELMHPHKGVSKEDRARHSGKGKPVDQPPPKKSANPNSYYAKQLEQRSGHLSTIELVPLPEVVPPPAQEIIPADINNLWAGQPWSQLDGEADEWFERFEIYRKLPAYRRNVRAVYSIQRQLSGLSAVGVEGSSNGAPIQWLEQSTAFQWANRASAYTKWEIQRSRIEEETERTVARHERRRLLKSFQQKVELAIGHVNLEKVTLISLSNVMEVFMQESRTEYNDNPAQKFEVSNMDDNQLVEMLKGMVGGTYISED